MSGRGDWWDFNFNPWHGCSEVSRGCDNCYARTWALRYGMAEWGPHAERVPAAESAWRRPLAWQRAVERGSTKRFVFPGFIDPFDKKAPPDLRARLFAMIKATPDLVWLLLSKRPQNFRKMLPADWGEGYPNCWLGVTAENVRETNRRLPILCRTPAVRRFVSAEPLLEAIDLRPWLDSVNWVVAGCESGPGKRPGERHTDPDWLRDLRDQCQEAGVCFWLKQMVIDGKVVGLPELDGRTWSERPAP